MKKIYRVEVSETVYHTTYVIAENEAEASTKISELIDEGSEVRYEDFPESDHKIGHIEEVEAGENLSDYRGDGNTIAEHNAREYDELN